MAKCGCSGGTCSCLLTAGTNIEVLGTGSSTNPYVLNVTGYPDSQPSETATWSGAVSLASLTGPRTIRATLTGNVTSITLPTWSSAMSASITLILTQDATGGRTWVMPGVSMLGIDIVLSTAAGARDMVVLVWTGAQWIAIPSAMAVS